MIVFDLRCGNAHVFEAWFRDSKEYERQKKRQQITCPVCGDTACDKALMAPAVTSSKEDRQAREQAMAANAYRKLAEFRRQVEENCDYVGEKFAEEALKIHHGETEKRGIYGEASKEEAENLSEEGVEFGLIPWMPRADN
ncbi:MAG: DUF1178 family protein [Alphaproteobacteria bacterium]|nr:DUF1178 family protein [Alphaproteobacteria bacterium]